MLNSYYFFIAFAIGGAALSVFTATTLAASVTALVMLSVFSLFVIVPLMAAILCAVVSSALHYLSDCIDNSDYVQSEIDTKESELCFIKLYETQLDVAAQFEQTIQVEQNNSSEAFDESIGSSNGYNEKPVVSLKVSNQSLFNGYNQVQQSDVLLKKEPDFFDF